VHLCIYILRYFSEGTLVPRCACVCLPRLRPDRAQRERDGLRKRLETEDERYRTVVNLHQQAQEGLRAELSAEQKSYAETREALVRTVCAGRESQSRLSCVGLLIFCPLKFADLFLSASGMTAFDALQIKATCNEEMLTKEVTMLRQQLALRDAPVPV
jgi:hypothetical protein